MTIIGSIGIGKSALACATAHFIHERGLFKGGCIYVDGKDIEKDSAFTRQLIDSIYNDSNH